MTSTELIVHGGDVFIDGEKADDLIAQMNAAVEDLADLANDQVVTTRKNASVVEAAARQAEAHGLETAAARLRLYAERRIGQLARDPRHASDVVHQFGTSQLGDFERLAAIPTNWKRVYPSLSFGVDDDPAQKNSVKVVDLFKEAVEHQLSGRRSHTSYSVWMTSLHNSAKSNPRHHGLYKLWDGTWLIEYTDPGTKRHRRERINGSEEHAVEVRNIRRGAIRPDRNIALLPIRGRPPGGIAAALDNVRSARKILGDHWADLTDPQKRELDGAYGRLDDLATAIIRAVDLG